MKTTKKDLENECAALRSALWALRPVRDLRPFSRVAWTGGSSPRKPSEVSRFEAAARRSLFREQANTHANFWKCATEWDTFRTFYRRAQADAHATFRGAFNQ